MTKPVKKELLLLKIETTKGTNAVPTGALDAILVEDASWSYAGARMVERNPIKGAFGMFQSIYAGTLLEVTFRAEIKGSGVAGTAPEIGPALRACGLGETIVASTSVTYQPVSDSIESCTIYMYEDGTRLALVGCQGNVNFVFKTGGIGYAEFTFTGRPLAVVDETNPAASYDSAVPPAIINAPFSALGYSAVIAALNFDLGNEVATPPSMSAADGYSDVIIVDRDMAGSFDPEAEDVATADFHGQWKGGTVGSITSGLVGSVAGNRYQATWPTAYYRELSPGDRDSLRTLEIGFGAAGDDAAFDLVFT